MVQRGGGGGALSESKRSWPAVVVVVASAVVAAVVVVVGAAVVGEPVSAHGVSVPLDWPRSAIVPPSRVKLLACSSASQESVANQLACQA